MKSLKEWEEFMAKENILENIEWTDENVLSATRVRKKALRDWCHRPKGERISQVAPVF